MVLITGFSSRSIDFTSTARGREGRTLPGYCSNGRGCALAATAVAGGLDLMLAATLEQPSRAMAKTTASTTEPRVVNDIPRPTVRQMALKAPVLPELVGCVWFMLGHLGRERSKERAFQNMLIRRELAGG